MEKKNTREGGNVDRKIANLLAKTGIQGVICPANGFRSGRVETLSFSKVTGCQFMVAGDNDSVQVCQELKAGEWISAIPHGVA